MINVVILFFSVFLIIEVQAKEVTLFGIRLGENITKYKNLNLKQRKSIVPKMKQTMEEYYMTPPVSQKLLSKYIVYINKKLFDMSKPIFFHLFC